MQPARSILRSKAFASRAKPMAIPLEAHPLLRATPAHGERWELLQRGTQDMISYLAATLRRTW